MQEEKFVQTQKAEIIRAKTWWSLHKYLMTTDSWEIANSIRYKSSNFCCNLEEEQEERWKKRKEGKFLESMKQFIISKEILFCEQILDT